MYESLKNTHYNKTSLQQFQSELRSYKGPNAQTYRQLSQSIERSITERLPEQAGVERLEQRLLEVEKTVREYAAGAQEVRN